MKKIIEKNLWIRKALGKPITHVRSILIIKRILKKLGIYSAEAWGENKNIDTFTDLYDIFSINFINLMKGTKEKIALVAFYDDEVNKYFIQTCKELDIEYEIFDPLREDFISEVKKSNIEIFLVRPSHKTQLARQMFLEKVEIIASELGKEVYPTIKEQKIYEAKRTLAYFLQANNIAHPKTWIFYDKKEAMTFIETSKFPLVFKTHNGAGASGVEILKSKNHAKKVVNACFNNYYLNKSITDYRDIDYGYVLLQEFIKDAREHRIIKIGKSWFGHEKALNGQSEFMSGSGVNLWTRPTAKILDFCRDIAEKHDFTTMCFDIFEDKNGNFLVNELQTWFGSYNPSQLYIDGVPGRLIYNEPEYVFEKGLFNHNQSLALIIVDLIERRGVDGP